MSIQAMKQALEALEWGNEPMAKEAITTLRAAIKAQEKCEPVGYLCKVGLPMYQRTLLEGNDPAKWEPLYTHPAPVEKCEPQYFGLTAQHTWLSVSKEQYEKLRESHRCVFFTHPAPVPAGWKLVPTEPTEKQWAEGKIVLEAMFDCGTSIDLGLIYKVMLQAAPKPGESHD